MLNYTITADIDTRDNSELYVLKIIDKLSAETYKSVAENIKKLNGYYSKFKHGFIFREELTASDIENILDGKTMTSETREIKNIHGVKIGDIFYTMWGYEQTNVDFFEVVRVTEKMATVKPIKQNRTETGWLQGNAEPIKGAFYSDGFYKESYTTRTYAHNNFNGNAAEPGLTNADGYGHAGFYYTGGSIGYSEYA